MDIEEICAVTQNLIDDVGRVASAAYEVLFHLSFQAHRQNFLSGKESSVPGMKAFEKAQAALSVGLDVKLKGTTKDIPMSLGNSRNEVKGAIKEFHQALTDRAKHKEKGTDYLEELAQIVQTRVVPEVTTFCSELQKFEDACKTDDMSRHRAVVDEAINDIETINSTINLIAVNASIEAALAGQAGRGFAIIAEEIQGLSQKSKRIVDEIRTSLR